MGRIYFFRVRSPEIRGETRLGIWEPSEVVKNPLSRAFPLDEGALRVASKYIVSYSTSVRR